MQTGKLEPLAPVTLLNITTTNRDLLTGIVDGDLIYNTTIPEFQGRQAGAWVSLGGGSITVGAASINLLDITTDEITALNQIINTTANSIYHGVGTGVNATDTATNNSAFGPGTLPLLTTGDDIIAIGNGVAPLLTSTSFLILIGNNAGAGLTGAEGLNSIAIGHNAMAGGGEFGSNTFIGHFAGQNAGGQQNTVTGYRAARELTAVQNAIYGQVAVPTATTSNNLAVFGQGTGTRITTGSNISLFGGGVDVPLGEGAISGYLNFHDLIFGRSVGRRMQIGEIGGVEPNDASFGDASLRLNQTDAAFMTNVLTTTLRDLIGTEENGMFIFNSTTGAFQGRQNAAWMNPSQTQPRIGFAVTSTTAGLGLAQIYACTDTTAARTLTLSTATIALGSTATPLIITVMDENGNASGPNTLTVDTQGGQLISGAATFAISTGFGSVTMYSDGSNLFIISTT